MITQNIRADPSDTRRYFYAEVTENIVMLAVGCYNRLRQALDSPFKGARGGFNHNFYL